VPKVLSFKRHRLHGRLARMPQSWSDFPVVDVAPDPATHQRLDDVTWPLFVAWTAWVVATPDRELSMAELPPRPRGYDWYLRLDTAQRRIFGDRYGIYIEDGLGGAVSERESRPGKPAS
jgi:hypothetical protein